jgi:predicted dehydrogenase
MIGRAQQNERANAMDSEDDLWLIGAGPMARRYAEALSHRGRHFAVIGRGEESAAAFEAEIRAPVRRGGLEAALRAAAPPRRAIVATPVAELAASCRTLLEAGVRSVLVEKPGALTPETMEAVAAEANAAGADIRVAYNRRFLPSVAMARAAIAEDGGVLAFAFEFSDPGERIAASAHPAEVKENWIYANGSHVIDLAFHLGGAPETLTAITAGTTAWHSRAARFAGAGRTRDGALFAYRANYEGPGSWGLEIDTPRRRLLLRPLESLSQQLCGAFHPEPLPPPPERGGLKPGLPAMLDAFLDGESIERLPDIAASARQAREIIARILEGGA